MTQRKLSVAEQKPRLDAVIAMAMPHSYIAQIFHDFGMFTFERQHAREREYSRP